MNPECPDPRHQFVSRWLNPLPVAFWNTARLAGEEDLRQAPDILFKATDPASQTSVFPGTGVTPVQHWVSEG